MQIFLVGGAVRDKLLNIDVHDQDWVVVGTTPEVLISKGFSAVGKDFPVFLHPETKQEYALARTERKTGAGYKGFDCYFSPDVTIEDDLLRRDLTINAMALDDKGKLIDPYGGQTDLNNRVLRHVSSAFTEDPLRVLRVARFAAKLHHLGFSIADETQDLMKQIVASKELEHLTAERIWQEWHKSLSTQDPQVFLSVLRDCGALKVILPELDCLFGVPQPEKWHPEIDTGIHNLMVAKQAAILTSSTKVRFAAQMHDLGKGVTPKNEWPSHKMHCHTGQSIIKQLCDRLRVPNDYRELALIVCKQHSNVHRAEELRAETLLKVLNSFDVWRKPERLDEVLVACMADSRGRTGYENIEYPQKAIFEQAYHAALSVKAQDIIKDGYQGADIRLDMDKRRVEAIKRSRCL
ncbi:multifunctional CCA addition/repair protein [Vibrio sp. OCN044]|uniref:Multifunctional CCA protein n=1 Tax=Vibrio tetraodonis subsp. pristinus TaxID=2695891 RepID=A0A6L8LYR6_9VIBR|nr:multifunctional CCA addition/repair protein [Vibrio tetraodonis]MYM60895.1 multifunctional CCA addition/repair protein [Vibrio tetraodonis subsp. pristinus]